MIRHAVLAALFAALSVPASAKDKPPEAPNIAAGPERLLAKAREVREETGCIEAAPTYRVVAAMGEGQEAAQHELGECLLLIDGASPEETALFRQEGVFWLTRAAYAGNARAQRALAVHFGARASKDNSPTDALKWALVYEKNGDATLYGYQSLPPTFVPGLKKDAGETGIATAEAFAGAFKPVALAKFTPPPPEKFKGPPRGEGPPPGGPGGRRPPPGG